MGRKARHKRERRESGEWHSGGRVAAAEARVMEVVTRSVFGRVEPERSERDGSAWPVAFFSDGKGPLMAIESDGRVVAVGGSDDGQATGN